MGLRNTAATFGWLTRGLHWLTAALVLAAVPLGLWIARMEPSLAALRYYGWHKTLGITVLALIVLRLCWHRVSPPPAPLPSGPPWQDRLARAVHAGLYIALVAMPLSGWIASSATGIDTVVFGRWTLPSIAPVSERWETAGFAVHGILAWGVVALVALHVAGAIRRGLKSDGTMRRMIRG